MKILIVKMSSMGDLIHTLPAITDAQKAMPGISFDWIAEEGFAEIPTWHPAVMNVFPIAIRRWRNNLSNSLVRKEIKEFIKQIKLDQYDYVIDAQGLLKSAIVSRLVKGMHCGMDRYSCKEPLSSFFYTKTYSITKNTHAIERVRLLFSEVLGYQYRPEILQYGLLASDFLGGESSKPYLVFLHGTSGDYKLWPVEKWISLRDMALAHGYDVYLPWGNEQEKNRAELIQGGHDSCFVLDRMALTEIAGVLAKASGVVGVDTGLAHLAAALSIPGVTIYVDTFPKLTGACGENQTCVSEGQQQDTVMTGLEVVYSEGLSAEDIWQFLGADLIR